MHTDSRVPIPECQAITAVILAGGRSRRMGGRDKGLLPLSGQPLIAHVRTRITPQVGSVTISANRHRDRYAAFGLPVMADTLPGHLGPLSGLLAAFEATRSEWLLTVPCDVPCLPDDLVRRLTETVATHGVTLAAPRTDSGIQAAILLVHRSEEPAVRAYLAAGERRVQGFLAKRGAAFADFHAEDGYFLNINTPEELCELEKRLAGGGPACR